MNINAVVDGAFEFRNIHPESTDDEVKLHLCNKLLEELKSTNTEKLLPHLRSVDLKKGERQIVVTLTFPWEVTASNFL